ncbi:unnamed protein product [Sphagnum jensenii]|uniref:Peptidase A2 domain-containing protein n=1 Tax=Sphagnum jensenii TaxID=128206 RepID=A0ABP0VHT1_9BRYO
MLVELTPAGVVPQAEVAEDGGAVNQENSIRSKILSHFIKGKVSLTPMEMVMMIPGELEQLKNLVKVAQRKRDAETEGAQVSLVFASPNLRRISVNKTHRSKTLHLFVEINSYLIEGLVDTGASMSVMAASVVREMGMMHLVSGSETYKTVSGTVTQAIGRIDEVSVKTGGVQCAMTFMIVDTDSYDRLLGFDFLIKIGVIVDVERGLIQESDDHADWIEWVANEERKRQALTGLANPEVPTLLQIQQVDNNASWKALEGQAVDTKESNEDSRWRDICEKLRIDPGLDELKRPMLWGVLERYRNIRMAPEDVKKMALITKTGLYDWNVMPFGLKNATSTFTRTMSLAFETLKRALVAAPVLTQPDFTKPF